MTEELLHILRCPICLSVKAKKNILPCSHSYCYDCIHNKLHNNDDNIYICNICNISHHEPSQGFTINHDVSRIVSLYQNDINEYNNNKDQYLNKIASNNGTTADNGTQADLRNKLEIVDIEDMNSNTNRSTSNKLPLILDLIASSSPPQPLPQLLTSSSSLYNNDLLLNDELKSLDEDWYKHYNALRELRSNDSNIKIVPGFTFLGDEGDRIEIGYWYQQQLKKMENGELNSLFSYVLKKELIPNFSTTISIKRKEEYSIDSLKKRVKNDRNDSIPKHRLLGSNMNDTDDYDYVDINTTADDSGLPSINREDIEPGNCVAYIYTIDGVLQSKPRNKALQKISAPGNEQLFLALGVISGSKKIIKFNPHYKIVTLWMKPSTPKNYLLSTYLLENVKTTIEISNIVAANITFNESTNGKVLTESSKKLLQKIEDCYGLYFQDE